MKLIIFSDSHYKIDTMRQIAEKLSKRINGIIHLGDCIEDTEIFKAICPGIPLYIVRGNNDYENGYPAERTINMYGYSIFMTHGHRQHVYYNTDRLYYSAAQNGANIALFGHTHTPYLQLEGNILVMNPGSISLPRSSAGKTFGLITFENGKAEAAIMSIENNNIKKLISKSF